MDIQAFVLGFVLGSIVGGTIIAWHTWWRKKRLAQLKPDKPSPPEQKVVAPLVDEHDAKHATGPLPVLIEAATRGSVVVWRALARNVNCPPEVLAILSKGGDWEVRESCARHPRTPPDCLELLMKEAENDVCIAMALVYNRNLPSAHLDKLLKRFPDCNDLRKGVAGNSNTSASTRRKLADDPHLTVRWFVASCPHAPLDVLQHIAEKDPVTENRRVALESIKKQKLDQNGANSG